VASFACSPVVAVSGSPKIVVLRHQLAILKRGGKRPQYTSVDRALLAAASRLLPPERWSCFAVSPQTLRRWHRALLFVCRRFAKTRQPRTSNKTITTTTRIVVIPSDSHGAPGTRR